MAKDVGTMTAATWRSVRSEAKAATTGIIVETITSTTPIILIAQMSSTETTDSSVTTPRNSRKKFGSIRSAKADTAKIIPPTLSTNAMRRESTFHTTYPAKSSGFI
jgi:hypothetical protein